MADTRKGRDTSSDESEKVSPSASERRKKVDIQIKAITTPKGDVPTIDSIKTLVEGLNILDSEITLVTEETQKVFLLKIKDLEREIISIKKLISELAISFETSIEKLNNIEPKLEKTSEILETQKTESAELARYIGAITNNLRREFIDYINLLEKKITEEIKKMPTGEVPDLKELSTKLDDIQRRVDKQVSESLQAAIDTKKTVEEIRQDIRELTKDLNDTLTSVSKKPDDIEKTLSSLGKAVETIKELVESPAEETNESKVESPTSRRQRSEKD